MHNSKCLILLLLLFSAKPFAQTVPFEKTDITGLWKGTLYNDSTQKYYRYEIGISEEKGKLSGFSHTFFLADDKEFYGVKKIKIKRANGKIIIEDAGLIANNYPIAPAKGVRQLNILILEIKDSIMTLTGPFSTNRTKEYASLTGTINLQRKNDFWQSALVPHLQELGMSNELSFVKKEYDLAKEEEAKKITAREIAVNNTEAAIKKETPVDKTKNAVKAEQKPTSEKQPVTKPAPSKPSEGKEVASNKNSEKTTTAKEIVKAEQAKEKEPNKTDTEIPSKETAAKAETKEIKVAEVKVVQPAAEVASRKTVLQQTVYFSTDSLQLTLYDNGEVDGDTVSVLMNGKVIMARERLSTNAVRKTIYADPSSDSINLVMYAENLGSIAPNTGLLVVHDGQSIYEIRFSGDLQKNASIILRRRKK